MYIKAKQYNDKLSFFKKKTEVKSVKTQRIARFLQTVDNDTHKDQTIVMVFPKSALLMIHGRLMKMWNNYYDNKI